MSIAKSIGCFGAAITVALLLTACGWWIEDDSFQDLHSAITSNDLAEIRLIAEKEPDLTQGDEGVMALSAGGCNPAVARLLVEELGFDVRSEALGGVVFQTLIPLKYEDPPYASNCTEGDLFESLDFYLQSGADPCISPEGDPPGITAAEAGSWGVSPRTVTLLKEASIDC